MEEEDGDITRRTKIRVLNPVLEEPENFMGVNTHYIKVGMGCLSVDMRTRTAITITIFVMITFFLVLVFIPLLTIYYTRVVTDFNINSNSNKNKNKIQSTTTSSGMTVVDQVPRYDPNRDYTGRLDYSKVMSRSHKTEKRDIDGSAFSSKELCETHNNRYWDQGSCKCRDPFCGPDCRLEKHSEKYFGVGRINLNSKNVDYNIINKLSTERGSFPTTKNDKTCSNYCDERGSECSGYIWESSGTKQQGGSCYLIGGDITIKGGELDITSGKIEPNLFVKAHIKEDVLKFPSKIILTQSKQTLKGKYWEESGHDPKRPITMVRPGKIYKLDYFPRYAKNDGNRIGYYSTKMFNLEDLKRFINNKETGKLKNWYVHRPDRGNISLPEEWTFSKEIYLVYL